MNVENFYEANKKSHEYSLLTTEQKNKLNIFDMLTNNAIFVGLLRDALDFFIEEEIEYSPECEAFLIKNKNSNESNEADYIGLIDRDNYIEVVDMICQCNNFTPPKKNNSKPRGKKLSEILQKIEKGRKALAKAKAKDVDESMDLANIISAVANRSNSLNIINIWDLTLFQLWDCFSRLTNNNIYDSNITSISVWGDKENKFDFNSWFKKINN